jgi:hypothetical protein
MDSRVSVASQSVSTLLVRKKDDEVAFGSAVTHLRDDTKQDWFGE